MSVERNPFDPIPTAELSIEIEPSNEKMEDGSTASLEYNQEDGGVTVTFTPPEDNRSNEQVEEDEEEFYRNLIEDLDGSTVAQIARDVYDDFVSDKDSRNDWESMFERGFDLLGIKLNEASEPFEGACTAALAEHLEQGETTITVDIQMVQHNSVGVSTELQAYASCIEIEDMTFTFEIEVHHGNRLIASGIVKRKLVDRITYSAKVAAEAIVHEAS